jgi:hypothetical protein
VYGSDSSAPSGGAGSGTLVSPNIIGITDPQSIGVHLGALAVTRAASFTWPVANLALFVPVTLQASGTWSAMFVYVVTRASAHLDIGIYDASGTQLSHSGSTSFGADGLQLVTIPAVSLAAGRYYLALVADSASMAFSGVTTSQAAFRTVGLLQQSAFPLPATATFAPLSTFASIPFYGLTNRSVM